MRTHNQEVDKVNHQLTEDNGKLVPTNQHTAHITWCDFANIHRTDGRSHSHADTTEHTIEVKHYEQGPVGLSLRKDIAFRLH